ncbi:MAG: 50S ribosomal protein L4 [Patescibacteria group bacterium]|nr:50S ribosomal protein L4 [Patescibacteria group bacterium]
MLKAKVYNIEGKVVGERELPSEIFGQSMSSGILQQAVTAQAANARQVLAHTKTRGEVRGGGRKPWKQKGTGRARHGSIRSPIWIGGGITFGPRPDRNFHLKINRKVRRQALCISLSAKAQEEAILLVDDLKPLGAKTKLAATLLSSLKLRSKKLSAAGKPASAPAEKPAAGASKPAPVKASKPLPARVLVVLPNNSGDLVRAFRNLPRVTVIAADSLNVKDVLGHRYLLMPISGLTRVSEVYRTAGPAKA